MGIEGARPQWRTAAVGSLGLVLMAALAVPARAASHAESASAAAEASTKDTAFELDVSNTADWHGGEPEIAVNPRDEQNVVMVWPEEDATGIYRNPVTGTFDVATGTAVGYANDPAFSRCGLGLSFDGGRSWQRSVLPAQTAQSTLCSDATVAAGPDGTFYSAVITFNQPTTPVPGVAPGTLPHVANMQPGQGSADAVIASSDGGRTWTYPPVDAIGNRGDDAERYAPGSSPETGGEGTSDRPWITVDQSTGTVYVTAMSDAIQFNGTTKTESWVTSSTDHARSFGTIYPVDDPSYPQSGPASMTASRGVLAFAYVGQQPGSSTNSVVFETSTDGGKTFSRHVLDAPAMSGGVVGVNVVGDAAHPGTYVVMVPDSGETGVLVYRTTDDGAHWTAPVTVGVGTSRPWLAASPNGAIVGVMGRDIHSDSSQDVLAAFSSDGGKTFKAPARVNGATAPAPPPGTITLYDDVSWIVLTDRHGFIGWGDWRKTASNTNGENNVWMARVPVAG